MALDYSLLLLREPSLYTKLGHASHKHIIMQIKHTFFVHRGKVSKLFFGVVLI